MAKNPYVLTRNKLNEFFTNHFESMFESAMAKFINCFIRENIALYTKILDKIDNEFSNDTKFTDFLLSNVTRKLEVEDIYISGVTGATDYCSSRNETDFKLIDFPATMVPGNNPIDQLYFMNSQRNRPTCPTKKIYDNVYSDKDEQSGQYLAIAGEYYDCNPNIEERCQRPNDARYGYGADVVSLLVLDWDNKRGRQPCVCRGQYDPVPFTYGYPTIYDRTSACGGSFYSSFEDGDLAEYKLTLETHFDKVEMYDFLYSILLTYAKEVVFKDNMRPDSEIVYPFSTIADTQVTPDEYYTKQEIAKQIIGNLIATLNIRDISTYIYNHKSMTDLKLRVYLSAVESVHKFYKNVGTISTSEFMIKSLKAKLLEADGDIMQPRIRGRFYGDVEDTDTTPLNNAAMNAGSEFMYYETISSLFALVNYGYKKGSDYPGKYADFTKYQRNSSATGFLYHVTQKIYTYFMIEGSLSTGDGGLELIDNQEYLAFIDRHPQWVIDSVGDRMSSERPYFSKTDMEIAALIFEELAVSMAKLTIAIFNFKYFLDLSATSTVHATREQINRIYDSRYKILDQALRNFERLGLDYTDEKNPIGCTESQVYRRLVDMLDMYSINAAYQNGLSSVNSRIKAFLNKVKVTNESENTVQDLAEIVAPVVGGTDVNIVEEFVNGEDVNIMNLEDKCEEAKEMLMLAQENDDYDLQVKCAKRLMALEMYYDKYMKINVSTEADKTVKPPRKLTEKERDKFFDEFDWWMWSEAEVVADTDDFDETLENFLEQWWAIYLTGSSKEKIKEDVELYRAGENDSRNDSEFRKRLKEAHEFVIKWCNLDDTKKILDYLRKNSKDGFKKAMNGAVAYNPRYGKFQYWPTKSRIDESAKELNVVFSSVWIGLSKYFGPDLGIAVECYYDINIVGKRCVKETLDERKFFADWIAEDDDEHDTPYVLKCAVLASDGFGNQFWINRNGDVFLTIHDDPEKKMRCYGESTCDLYEFLVTCVERSKNGKRKSPAKASKESDEGLITDTDDEGVEVKDTSESCSKSVVKNKGKVKKAINDLEDGLEACSKKDKIAIAKSVLETGTKNEKVKKIAEDIVSEEGLLYKVMSFMLNTVGKPGLWVGNAINKWRYGVNKNEAIKVLKLYEEKKGEVNNDVDMESVDCTSLQKEISRIQKIIVDLINLAKDGDPDKLKKIVAADSPTKLKIESMTLRYRGLNNILETVKMNAKGESAIDRLKSYFEETNSTLNKFGGKDGTAEYTAVAFQYMGKLFKTINAVEMDNIKFLYKGLTDTRRIPK